MQPATPTQKLATLLLGEPLEGFVMSRREERRSWRLIARDLYDATDCEIDVTATTLSNWYSEALTSVRVA